VDETTFPASAVLTEGQRAPGNFNHCRLLHFGAAKLEQEAQLSLTNRLMLVLADVPCCAVNSCPLVNYCHLLAVFSKFYPPLSHLAPSMRRIPSSYQVNIWYGRTGTTELQSGEGRKMFASVVWAQHINVTDTQTAASHYRTNALRHATETFGQSNLAKAALNPGPLTIGGSEPLSNTMFIRSPSLHFDQDLNLFSRFCTAQPHVN